MNSHLIIAVFSLAIIGTGLASQVTQTTNSDTNQYTCVDGTSTVPGDNMTVICSAVWNYELVLRLTADQPDEIDCGELVQQGDAYKRFLESFMRQSSAILRGQGCAEFTDSESSEALREKCTVWAVITQFSTN